ncbi:hypothetical protein BDZ97DRAFT_1755936 [Flammula alnicola]|nr:hypothetical protein BDZ97DRAFT_1755936 [Flammula alnicola]
MSATPPGTPRPASKWASRMGAAMRRSSTILSIARPSTPASGERDSDSSSLRRVSSRDSLTAPTVVTPPPTQLVSVPTPIAESPAREAEATQQETVGPSPLAQQTVVATQPSESTIAASPEPVQPAVATEQERATSPIGYVPPPVIDSSVGNPGAFTDDPEALPQPDVVKDPYAASNTGPPPPPAEEQTTTSAEFVPPPVVDSSAGNPGAFTEEPATLPQPEVVQDPDAAINTAPPPPAEAHAVEEHVVEEHVVEAREEPVTAAIEAPVLEQTVSYFDKPMAESMLDFDPTEHVPTEFVEAADANTSIAAPAPIPEVKPQEPDYEQGEAASYYRGEPSMPIAEPHQPAADEYRGEHQSEPAARETGQMPAPAFGTTVMPSYDLPEYMSPDIWGGASHNQKPHNVWASSSVPPREQEEQRQYVGSLPIPIPVPVGEPSGNGHGSLHSRASSFKMPNPHPEITEDPFADPVPPIIAITQSEAPQMPQPEVSEQHSQIPIETHEDARGAIVMPLPAFHEVVPPQPIHQIPSQQSSFGGSRMLETDERIPLLARPTTPNKRPNSYLQPARVPTPTNQASVSPLASSSWNPHGVSNQPRLHELGWLEYHLPDGTIYYVHPTRRVTTDVNLRLERVLTAVEAWMDERRDETLDVGVEAWLREVKDGKKGGAKAGGRGGKKGDVVIYFERYWVDHHARTVVKDDEEDRRVIGYVRGHIHGHGGHGKGKKQAGASAPKNEEDQLDMEYRFWSFMEAHPAHTALPHKSKAEAMDVLTWAWTDRLLPSQRPIPAPFTQEECQELMALLRSFDSEGHHDDHGIRTRVVARILLRVALWRQTYFRPNKPLPKDVSSAANALPVQHRPIRRAMFDFLISCLCLGIPYLFLERARLSSRVDQESGMFRNGSPLIVIGACTCLVAAIVLSASVTFLALPGLDNVARTAGMVAVIFAAFSMVATGVAILRHKADMERPISHVGIEGLMVISRRTVALSLPMVFLTYSLIGFITAVVLYTFRGASVDDPHMIKNSFEDYTRWTVVGVVGVLAGIVTTSMLVLRR